MYKLTSVESSFGFNTLAIVEGKPKILNLKEFISEFVNFREETVVRRIKFDLSKTEERAHILIGIATAVENIDAIIKIIKSSKEQNISSKELTEKITKNFLNDCSYLNCESPTHQPRATEHIDLMIKMINKLNSSFWCSKSSIFLYCNKYLFFSSIFNKYEPDNLEILDLTYPIIDIFLTEVEDLYSNDALLIKSDIVYNIFNIDIYITLKIMGEAKRREELGLTLRQKKVEINKSDRYFSWLPITKSRIKKYPYMGVATMALGAIIFLVSGGANSIN